MREFLLTKVRLTSYFVIFLILFNAIAFLVPMQAFEGGALTLFTVNSFLYGFYVAPILAGQKARIEELHKIIRAEANALFSMVLKTKKMSKSLRNQLQVMTENYIRSKVKRKRPDGGEQEYEELIGFCLSYSGKEQEQVDKFLDALVSNQQNRTNLNMQLANKVYSNEWMVMLILFSITLGFIMLINVGDSVALKLVKALLCAGLSMLILILVKLSTLTHKKAREIWNPLTKLIVTRFYRID